MAAYLYDKALPISLLHTFITIVTILIVVNLVRIQPDLGTSLVILLAGLYDPEEYGLNIEMWSNSEGEELKKESKNPLDVPKDNSPYTIYASSYRDKFLKQAYLDVYIGDYGKGSIAPILPFTLSLTIYGNTYLKIALAPWLGPGSWLGPQGPLGSRPIGTTHPPY